MASIRQLQDKVKTFQDFKKVVNIQKIVVMKEVAERKKVIGQVKFRNQLFNNYMIDLYKKYGTFDHDWFSDKGQKVPVKRDLHFVMANPVSDRIGDYAQTLITEFAKKNHSPDDVYVVIGTDLSDHLEANDLNIISRYDDKAITDPRTFERISYQLLRAFKDFMFVRSTFMYLNVIERRVKSEVIFPFSDQKVVIDPEEVDKLGDMSKTLYQSKIRHATFYKNVEKVAERVSKFAIEMKVYRIMIEYRLSMKMRELQSLDDKEKNIDSEIDMIKLKMQRIRKENVTNELLTNAAAFQALSESEGE